MVNVPAILLSSRELHQECVITRFRGCRQVHSLCLQGASSAPSASSTSQINVCAARLAVIQTKPREICRTLGHTEKICRVLVLFVLSLGENHPQILKSNKDNIPLTQPHQPPAQSCHGQVINWSPFWKNSLVFQFPVLVLIDHFFKSNLFLLLLV